MAPLYPLKANAPVATEAPQQEAKPTRRVLTEALQYFSDRPGLIPAWAKAELVSLQKEQDQDLLAGSLLHIAGRLKNREHLEASTFLLGRLANSEIPSEQREKAAAELAAMTGGGGFGRRAEFLLSRFSKDSTNGNLILPMLGATFVGQAVGSLALGRLLLPAARGTGGLLSSAYLARTGAASAGFLAEASAFTVFGRALSPQAHGTWGEDFARSALTIGVLKTAGYAGHGVGNYAARTPLAALPSFSRVILPQGTALAGLMAAHRLEERVGLRPHVEGQNLFFESLATLLTLNVGARLGRHALGENFNSAQGELAFRARQLSTTPRWPELFRPRQPALALVNGFPSEIRNSTAEPKSGPGQVWMMANSMGGADGLGGKGNGGRRGQSLGSGMVRNERGPSDPNQRPQTVDPADIEMIEVEPDTVVRPGPVSESTVEISDPFIGQVIDGRYSIDGVLGEGGMGIVYRSTHQVLRKPVAIKVLKGEAAKDPEVLARFLNEAQAASQIGNPHITEVSDYGRFPNGDPYLVMEFLKGKTLWETIENSQPMPSNRLVYVAKQLAEGLSAAHEVGIVHRDLKPENVFLSKHGNQQDFVKILDFGIAKVANSSANTRLTREGAVFGTPAYMSPEQIAGNPDLVPVDHRSDIYSFGIMLYEMATGRLPFEAPNVTGLYAKHMYEIAKPPREMVSDPESIPLGLQEIILKCINKDPAERYNSMGEIIAELSRLEQGIVPFAVVESASRTQGPSIPDWFKNGLGPKKAGANNGNSDGSRADQTYYIPRNKPFGRRLALGTGLLAIAGGAGVAGFYAFRKDDDKNPKVEPSAEPPTQPTQPQVTPVPPDAPPAPEKTTVVFSVEPADAQIFHDDKDMGKSPVLIKLDKGSKMELVVRREGYKTQAFVIDGKQEKPSLKLEKDGKTAPPPSGYPRPKGSGSNAPKNPKTPKPKGSAEEIFIPWQ